MALITSGQQNLIDRLGSDVAYPLSGSFQSRSGVDLLLQDIQRLLLTIPGERPNRPDFGCNLRGQLWENIYTAATDGAAAITEALQNYEPRISVINVDSTINENTGLIIFNVQFNIIDTDTNINLIFPYRAGTQLSFA